MIDGNNRKAIKEQRLHCDTQSNITDDKIKKMHYILWKINMGTKYGTLRMTLAILQPPYKILSFLYEVIDVQHIKPSEIKFINK